MFTNIGGKIKTLAQVLTWIGIIASCLTGFVMIVTGLYRSGYSSGMLIVMGFLIAIVGSFISWISAFFTYGFGELVENSAIIAGKKVNAAQDSEKAPDAAKLAYSAPEYPTVAPKRQALENMLREGLITEEEFNEKTAQL